MDPAAEERALAELNRQFRGGMNLDREVLLSVLELHQGDVQQTVQFLQAQEGDFVDPGPAEGLPKDYMKKPNNWVQPKAVNSSILPDSLEGRCNTLKDLVLSSESTFLQLYEAADSELFVPLLLLLVEQGVEFGAPPKAKLLAIAMAKKRYDLLEYLLARPQYMFGLPEVLRATKILDMPRKIRQLNKKIERLEQSGHAQAKTLRSLRTRLADLAREFVDAQISSVNGALAKRLRRWVGTIPAAHLQFFALQMPVQPWRELADVCHFSPKDFALDWFLPFVFGQEPPADSLLKIGALTSANVVEVVKKHQVPYSYLRKQVQNMSNQVRALVAGYEKLSMVIWYYEELECAETDVVLNSRLASGEDPELPYGKLMERILYMKQNGKSFYEHLLPIAERRLKSIKLPLEPPVVVFGDASYSMDVAIRVSTIIASLLTVLADADIQFFNVETFAPSKMPKTIPQVLDVALNTKADGLTATACTLKRFYDEKKPVKFFIMVTDEIENEASDGIFFAQLFYKYYMEVHPARLVMVSFLDDPNQKGRMVRALEEFGIAPLQFRLDAKRPDLTKLDSLLGILSAEANFFSIQAKMLAASTLAGSSLAELVAQIRQGPDAARRAASGGNDNNVSQEDSVNVVAQEEEKLSLIRRYRLTASVDGASAPEGFVCPITGEVMEDPVIASDGHTYERSAIVAWFAKSLVSPMTNQPLDTKMVFPNVALRGQIISFVESKMK